MTAQPRESSLTSDEQSATAPLISVVTPSFNREYFLRRTIDSILSQDYPNVECIVIDGGSTDNSLEILKSYGSRIRWISEPDEGQTDAINKGWQMARGDVLAWLNADDVWAPGAARTVADYLAAHPDVDMVYGDCGFMDTEGNVVGIGYTRAWNLEDAIEYCDHMLLQPSAFVRRSAVDRAGYLNKAFYQKMDQEYWVRVGLQSRVEYVPAVLAYASNHPGVTADGRTLAPACLQVTREIYRSPHLPPALRRKERRAFSNAHLQAARYALERGLYPLAVKHGCQALVTDPGNIKSAVTRPLMIAQNKFTRRPSELQDLPSAPRVPFRLPLGQGVLVMKTDAALGAPPVPGSEELWNLLERWAETGLRIDLVAADAPARMAAVGVRVQRLPEGKRETFELDIYRRHIRAVRAARALVHRQRPSFLFAEHTLADYSAVTVSRREELPLILSFRGTTAGPASGLRGPVRNPGSFQLAEQTCLRHAHLLLAWDDRARQELMACGVEEARVVVAEASGYISPESLVARLGEGAAYTKEEPHGLCLTSM